MRNKNLVTKLLSAFLIAVLGLSVFTPLSVLAEETEDFYLGFGVQLDGEPFVGAEVSISHTSIDFETSATSHFDSFANRAYVSFGVIPAGYYRVTVTYNGIDFGYIIVDHFDDQVIGLILTSPDDGGNDGGDTGGGDTGGGNNDGGLATQPGATPPGWTWRKQCSGTWKRDFWR